MAKRTTKKKVDTPQDPPFLTGLFKDRPKKDLVPGTIYFARDTKKYYRVSDDGTSWESTD